MKIPLRCRLGWHKWLPREGTHYTEFVNKWVSYEHAMGYCGRGCGVEERDIHRDEDFVYHREPTNKEVKRFLNAQK